MKAIETTTALALVLALTPATGLAAGSFDEVDADGNQALTESEFEQVSRGAFDAWDENQDQRITANELYRGVFSAWDENSDNQLDQEEYRTGYTAWFDEEPQPGFEEISGNDEMVAQDEFVSGLREADVLTAFSAEGQDGVDWSAFHTALFDVYDGNGDDMLAEDEYAQLDTGAQTGVQDTQATGAISGEDAIQAEVIALPEWQTDALYADGRSVEFMLDETEVYGPDGEEIGSLENIVFSNDGRVLSVVAEVGGFWDIADTHVNVPWDEVEFAAGRMTIPVTEENAEDYSLFKTSYLGIEEAASETMVVEDDLQTGTRAFRASELIGDYARIRDQGGGENAFVNYGYVNDLIIRDGQLAAVVVSPDAGYAGPGYYAYPYYGYGWAPGTPYYNMPYGEDEVAQVEPLDYDRLED